MKLSSRFSSVTSLVDRIAQVSLIDHFLDFMLDTLLIRHLNLIVSPSTLRCNSGHASTQPYSTLALMPSDQLCWSPCLSLLTRALRSECDFTHPSEDWFIVIIEGSSEWTSDQWSFQTAHLLTTGPPMLPPYPSHQLPQPRLATCFLTFSKWMLTHQLHLSPEECRLVEPTLCWTCWMMCRPPQCTTIPWAVWAWVDILPLVVWEEWEAWAVWAVWACLWWVWVCLHRSHHNRFPIYNLSSFHFSHKCLHRTEWWGWRDSDCLWWQWPCHFICHYKGRFNQHDSGSFITQSCRIAQPFLWTFRWWHHSPTPTHSNWTR